MSNCWVLVYAVVGEELTVPTKIGIKISSFPSLDVTHLRLLIVFTIMQRKKRVIINHCIPILSPREGMTNETNFYLEYIPSTL